MKHMPRTHRVDLDWLFERIRTDPGVFIKFVGTKQQIADMLTKGSFGAEEGEFRERSQMAVLVAVLIVTVTSGAFIDSFRNTELSREMPSTTAEIGDMIFSQFIIPFEAISVLLLAALIGSVVIARRNIY